MNEHKISPQAIPKKSWYFPYFSKFSPVFLLIILALFTGALGALAFRYQQLLHKNALVLPKKLLVENIYPNSKSPVSLPENIVITFSLPVDAHTMSHFVAISPDIEGSFSQRSDAVVVFTPTVPFARGGRYDVLIKKDLVSIGGQKLQQDYSSFFTTSLADNTIQFVIDNIAGRLLQFQANKSLQIKVNKADNLTSKVTYKLYNSSETELLAFLSYERDKKIQVDSTYTRTEDTYFNQSVPHSTFQFIKDIDEADSKLSLTINPGIYYLEALGLDQKPIGTTFLIANTTGITLRQDDNKLQLTAMDLPTNKELTESVTARLYNLASNPTVLAEIPFTGSIQTPWAIEKRIDLILAKRQNETLVIPLQIPLSQADLRAVNNLDKTYKVFVYTDRPIYKPGDTVFVRGLARIDSDALYGIPPAGAVLKIQKDYNDKNPISVATDEHGNFWTSFVLPAASGTPTPTSQYDYPSDQTMSLTVSGDAKQSDRWGNVVTYGSAWYSVASYTKPSFDITVSVDHEELNRPEIPTFTIKAKNFDGTAHSGVDLAYEFFEEDFFEVEKTVYNQNFNVSKLGGMCGGGISIWEDYFGGSKGKGSIKLDASGQARVPLDKKILDTMKTSKRITLVASTKDDQGNKIQGAKTATIHAANLALFFLPSSNRYTFGQEMVVPFYAEDLSGSKKANTSFSYKLWTSTYNNNVTNEDIKTSGTVSTDENGRGIIRYQLPTDTRKSVSFTLTLEGKDEQESSVFTDKYLTITDTSDQENSYWEKSSTTQTYLKISSSKNSFIVGDTMTLAVTSPIDLDALMTLERGRIYNPQIIHLSKGENTIQIPVNSDLSPSVTIVFSFFAGGSYRSEGLALNVPAMHKLLDISISSDKPVYAPLETAHLTIKTLDNATKSPLPAQLSLAVVDRAIFALRKSATPPIHSTLYAFRDRSTTSSSSQTLIGTFLWGGGGGGGGGGDSSSKLTDTLYWNPNLSTDGSGIAIVDVPLGNIITTWRAMAIGATDDSHAGQSSLDFLVTH